MSTAIMQKTPVEAKWNTRKIQEEASQTIARQFLATMATLGKYGPEAHQELVRNIVNSKAEYYKSLNVKTPIELVQAMSEFEVNVLGSQIEIVGDEKKAEIIYNQCACWTAMQKVGHLTPEQEERMGKHFEITTQKLAEAFGFKGEVRFENEKAFVTFSK